MLNELLIYHPLLMSGFLALLSLLIGSALNAIIYRLPLMIKAEWKQDCQQFLALPQSPAPRINLFLPRSFCPHCKEKIPFWHNIPLLSYALLWGHCHLCKKRISWHYPLIEAITMILSLFGAFIFGFNLTLLYVLFFIWLILCLTMIDLEHQILPDVLTLGLLWLGLIANTQNLFTSLPNAVLSAASGYLFLWLFIKLFYLFTGKIGMGQGDFKLFAAMGAWFGWTALPLVLFGASLSGAIVGVVYLTATGKTKNTPIPFGPFLCLAGLVVLFARKKIFLF